MKDYTQGNYYNTLLDKMRSRASNSDYIDRGDKATQKFMQNPFIITDEVGHGTQSIYGHHRGSRYFGDYRKIGPSIIMGGDRDHDGVTRKGILAHEFGHADNRWLTNDENINKEITSRNKQLQDGTITEDHHDALPSETRSDLIELRHDLQDKGIFDSTGEFVEFTIEDLKKAKQSTEQYAPTDPDKEGIGQRLFKYFSDEDIIWMMNNVADASEEIQDDIPGDTRRAKYGGKRKLKKRRSRTY